MAVPRCRYILRESKNNDGSGVAADDGDGGDGDGDAGAGYSDHGDGDDEGRPQERPAGTSLPPASILAAAEAPSLVLRLGPPLLFSWMGLMGFRKEVGLLTSSFPREVGRSGAAMLRERTLCLLHGRCQEPHSMDATRTRGLG